MKRILATYLVLTAVAVFLNLMLTPVYHDGSSEYPVWRILNWFMAAGVLVSLASNFVRRRSIESESARRGAVTLDHAYAAAAWYGAIVLTMLFFWEWFWTLNPDSETGDAVTSHLVYFPIVDSLFVVVALSTGRCLWSHGDGSSSPNRARDQSRRSPSQQVERQRGAFKSEQRRLRNSLKQWSERQRRPFDVEQQRLRHSLRQWAERQRRPFDAEQL